MTALIDVRIYQAHVGQRDKLMRLLSGPAFPAHRDLGMRALRLWQHWPAAS